MAACPDRQILEVCGQGKKGDDSMRKLTVFNLVTVDGYFSGRDGDISWHNVDEEFQELAEQAANSGNTLLFGRVTYELMAATGRLRKLSGMIQLSPRE